MKPPSIRRIVAALAVLLTVAALSAIPAGAAESEPEYRSGTTAFASRDFEPENQVTRLYMTVLGRDPIASGDSAGLAFWVSKYTSGTSLRAIAGELSKSPEFMAKYGNTDNAGFVAALYINVFGAPDAGGQAYWTDQLDTGKLTRNGVIVSFSESEQFRNQTFDYSPLNRLYCAFFLRTPDPAGEAYWQDQYREQNVNLGPIAGVFASGDEFSNTYGSLSDREFVELIYKNVLGRALPLEEVAGPNYWTSLLGRRALTRGDVMVGFSEAQEYKNRFTDGSCPEAGNATPSAVNDRATVLHHGSVDINWLQNDVVPTGTVVNNIGSAGKGTVVNNGDGTFTYTHTAASTAAGSDSFTYRLRSADGINSTATVSITILAQGADGIPTAVDDNVTTDYETPVVIGYASNDTTDDTVTVKSITTPSNGTVVNNGDNTFTYTPKAGFSGDDSFNYTLTDDGASPDTSTAKVSITVRTQPGEDDGISPVANADRAITKVNTSVDIGWAGNDTLVDNAWLAEFTQPENGTVVDSGGGTFTYTPKTDYTASRTVFGLVSDTFSYTLRDDDAGVSTTTVRVLVLAQPECEVFMNYPYAPAGGATQDDKIELFFSNEGCFELYPTTSTRDVLWSGVKVDGAAVTPTPDPTRVLRAFAPVTAGNRSDNRVLVEGEAVLTVDGGHAVKIQFRLAFDWSGTEWVRDSTVFRGRGDADVQVLINPLS